MGLRGLWLFVGIFVWMIFLKKRFFVNFSVLICIFLALAINLLVAGDISRSMSFLLPVAVVGMLLLLRSNGTLAKRLIYVTLGFNLLLPANHVIVTFKIPILNLYAEIKRYQNPPEYLTADFYIKRGLDYRQQGKTGEAFLEFDQARRIKPDNPMVYLNIGQISREIGQTEYAHEVLVKGLELAKDISLRQQFENEISALEKTNPAP